jgi:N-acetyl-anhydromuramyl-L-alanine amidase AmpD
VLAAGKGYHAGPGRWRGVVSGNSQTIGIEAENDGVGEPWPEVQMDAYARGVAAILKHIGADEQKCCGHKEWAIPKGRKIDPTFDMNEFRARVAKFL